MAGAAAQPRRLALLAMLGVAGERGLTRDKIIGFLWPDADEERARRALTQALYALRQDLGSEEAFLGVKDLRLNPEIISADVVEFRARDGCRVLERAVELYRGPFLDGFHLPGAEEFERWSEQERQSLARSTATCSNSWASVPPRRATIVPRRLVRSSRDWIHSTPRSRWP